MELDFFIRALVVTGLLPPPPTPASLGDLLLPSGIRPPPSLACHCPYRQRAPPAGLEYGLTESSRPAILSRPAEVIRSKHLAIAPPNRKVCGQETATPPRARSPKERSSPQRCSRVEGEGEWGAPWWTGHRRRVQAIAGSQRGWHNGWGKRGGLGRSG